MEGHLGDAQTRSTSGGGRETGPPGPTATLLVEGGEPVLRVPEIGVAVGADARR